MHVTRTTEVMVGLFVALGLVSLFFLAMDVSNLGNLRAEKGSYTITARFENIGGLKVRAPVSVAGVRIGSISAIGFDSKTYQAIVSMRINPAFNTLPVDSSASILTSGLLGEQYISLMPGGAEENLKEGDQLELTQSALILEQVVSRFLFSKAEGGTGSKSVSNGNAQPSQ